MSYEKRGGLFPRKLSDCAQRATAPLMKRQGAAETRLLTHWADIAGPVLSRYTQPQKIAFARDAAGSATLHLLVQSGWATEVQHQEPLLLERIASFFGYRAVTRLAIRQGYIEQPAAAPSTPLPKKQPVPQEMAQMIEEVSDPELRSALSSLAGFISPKLS